MAKLLTLSNKSYTIIRVPALTIFPDHKSILVKLMFLESTFNYLAEQKTLTFSWNLIFKSISEQKDMREMDILLWILDLNLYLINDSDSRY